MDIDKLQPDLQAGNNTAFLLKQETHALILNFKHAKLEWERIVL
jgi:hypothetical protein